MRTFLLLFALFCNFANAENYIFLIDGQSNASSRGDLADVPVYENASRIFMYGNDLVYKKAIEPLDSAVNQVDTKMRDSNAGAGYAIPFANKLLNSLNSNDTITLVPCALGGSAVASWRQIYDTEHYYGICLKRMYEAKAITGGKFAGISRWQGEAETSSQALADTWNEKTSNYINNMRVDLQVLNLPVILVMLNNVYPNTAPYTYWTYLRNWMSKFWGYNVAMISSDGVTFQSDKIHATTDAYIEIAEERMVPAYLNMNFLRFY